MTPRKIAPAPGTPMQYSPQGQPLCRQCRTPISYPRTFCGRAECSYLWKCRRSPEFFKSECERLYPAQCAECGITQAERVAKEFPNLKKGGFRCPPYIRWEADHCRPLWSGQENDPEIVNPRKNGCILCPECHGRKSALEATERAKLKRQPEAEKVLQLLRSSQFRLGATFKALRAASGLGEELLRSCLGDLIAENLAEHRASI